MHGSGALAVKSRGSALHGHYEHDEELELHDNPIEEEEDNSIQVRPIFRFDLDPRAFDFGRSSWRHWDLDGA